MCTKDLTIAQLTGTVGTNKELFLWKLPWMQYFMFCIFIVLSKNLTIGIEWEQNQGCYVIRALHFYELAFTM